MTCRFQIKIARTNLFHCAVHDGFFGWAHLWKSGDEVSDPCPLCKLAVEGDPMTVAREVQPDEWGRIAGGRIREEDWAMLEKVKNEQR